MSQPGGHSHLRRSAERVSQTHRRPEWSNTAPPSRHGYVKSPSGPSTYRPPYAETVSSNESGIYAADGVLQSSHANIAMPRTLDRAIYRSTRDYPRAPPPASHRSAPSSIGTYSYMDVDSAVLRSPSINSSISQRGPSSQHVPSTRSFQPSALRQEPAVPEDYYREYRDPQCLYPTPVRPPVAFKYILEPASSTIFNRTPGSSGSAYTPNSHGHLHPPQPRLRPREGSYRVISPLELAVTQAKAVHCKDGDTPSASSADLYPISRDGGRDAYSKPFLYETGRSYAPPSAEHHPASASSHEECDYYMEESSDDQDEPSAYPSSLQDHSSAVSQGSGAQSGFIRTRVSSEGDISVVEVEMPGGTLVRVVQPGRKREEGS